MKPKPDLITDSDDQIHPAGRHVPQTSGEPSMGLPQWIAANPQENIANTDIVLWHTFGLHHVVRAEDFPVQPCISCGFKLMPAGFFDQNPVIDLPRVRNEASCCASHAKG